MTPVLVPFLVPFAGVYWFALRFDCWRRSRRAVSLPRPVISIGNLTVGGTGKTPLMIALTSTLLSHSKKPGVLTRGYAGFNAGETTSDENDEALLLSKRCPGVRIGTGANRVRAAEAMLNEYPIDVFLLDDGFQHWPIKRQLDLVCIDATNPWGGGWLIPAGRLREPRTALHRAHAVIVNRLALISESRREALLREIGAYVKTAPVFISEIENHLIDCATGKKLPLETLKGRRVLAMSAIGNPKAFEDTLTLLGVDAKPVEFPDHHAYSVAEVEDVIEEAKEDQRDIVLTEKDWVKIELLDVDRKGFFILGMDLKFPPDQQQRLEAMIEGVVH